MIKAFELIQPTARAVIARLADPQGKKEKAAKRCEAALREAKGALESVREALIKIQYTAPLREPTYNEIAELSEKEKDEKYGPRKPDPKNMQRLDAYVELFRIADTWNKSPEIRSLHAAFDDKRAPQSFRRTQFLKLDKMFAELSDPKNGWNRAHVNCEKVSPSSIYLSLEFTQNSDLRPVEEWDTNASLETCDAIQFMSIVGQSMPATWYGAATYAAHQFTHPRSTHALQAINQVLKP